MSADKLMDNIVGYGIAVAVGAIIYFLVNTVIGFTLEETDDGYELWQFALLFLVLILLLAAVFTIRNMAKKKGK
jgi:ABC-type branched-subunit amino acid transport system permease subunit